MATKQDTGDKTPPTLGQGLFLLAVITVLVIFAGILPAEQALLAATGVDTQGRVVAHRNVAIGGGHRGTRFFTKAVYRFALPDGGDVTGESSFDTTPLPAVGETIGVRYLAYWPRISTYDNAGWTHLGFWCIAAFFLVLAWIWVLLAGKVARLARGQPI